ncbi:hypothetical protein [Marinicella meishanensis]|uniref:hypothetical protein n=1 Tax=Marinicella meishanensis TaxID=2873263 RepID=UPI001CC177DC|nr:hypothetical protein [Marinicella sp. NBU2979]
MNTATNPMTTKPGLIKALVRKDLELNAAPLALYLVVGLISLWLLTFDSKGPFYAGSVLLLSMVIVASAHLVINTVTTERDDQTLTFIMSLPITFIQYTHAKICANLLGFMTFWLIMWAGVMGVIFSQAEIPNGLAVYATILLLEMLAVFVLLLGVGLISESQTWTIVVMSLTNIGLSLFMYWLSSVAAIKSHMDAADPVWNATAWTIIAAELAFILLALGLTYYGQSRKRDFL